MIFALIVTYSDRHNYTKAVIEACQLQKVDHIVLVDNNSSAKSRFYYETLCNIYKNLNVISNEENLGSSGGYKVGLEFIQQFKQVQFIWLLDDDNVPESGALEELISTRTELLNTLKTNDVVVYSYRSRLQFRNNILHNSIYRVLLPNNFCGFHYKKIVNYFKPEKTKHKYKILEIDVGPYGGMFISMDILRRVGLPNPSFFVYADDYEWTIRMTEYGIKHYIVFDSIVNDIQQSGNLMFPTDGTNIKTYYGLRNHTYLSQRYKFNTVLYSLNKIMFLAGLVIKPFLGSDSLPTFSKRITNLKAKLIIANKAIADGEQGKLGVNKEIS